MCRVLGSLPWRAVARFVAEETEAGRPRTYADASAQYRSVRGLISIRITVEARDTATAYATADAMTMTALTSAGEAAPI